MGVAGIKKRVGDRLAVQSYLRVGARAHVDSRRDYILPGVELFPEHRGRLEILVMGVCDPDRFPVSPAHQRGPELRRLRAKNLGGVRVPGGDLPEIFMVAYHQTGVLHPRERNG